MCYDLRFPEAAHSLPTVPRLANHHHNLLLPVEAPAEGAAPAATKDKKQRHKKRTGTFSSYIFNVLKQVHPQQGDARHELISR
jgi:hypothetical protein